MVLELQERPVAVASEPEISPSAEAPAMQGMRRRVLSLAWPVIAQNLLETLVGVVDTLLVARLGAVAIAGHAVAITVDTLMLTIPLGVGQAMSVRVAHELGCGNPRGARASCARCSRWGCRSACRCSASAVSSRCCRC